MKKMIALLTVLSLLFVCFSVLAEETDISFDDMPGSLYDEDPDAVIEESAFEGSWVPGTVFVGPDYYTLEELASEYRVNAPSVTIAGGKVTIEVLNSKGKVIKNTSSYEFEDGMLFCPDEKTGQSITFDLLVDGTVLMTQYVPDGDDELKSVSFFLVRAEE